MSIIDIFIAVVAPFMYVLCLTGVFVYLFGKKHNFQTLLPLALISATLFVFIFTAIFHNISAGFWLTVIAALAFIPLVILDKYRYKTLREKMFTPGFVIFSIIYIVICLLNWQKAIPLLSDSSMHWAPHVWTMWLRNDFYTSPNMSIVIHGDYPPIIQLFELIWAKAAGLYREGLLLVAIQILSFSMLFPIFNKFDWRKEKKLQDWFMALLFAVTLLSIPLSFFVSDFYSNIEVDTALAFVFAYGVYLAITESKKFTISGLIKLSLLIAFLCLAKQIAVLLAGVIMLIYLSNLYISHRKQIHTTALVANWVRYFKNWREHWKITGVVLLAATFPLFCMKLWSTQIVNYQSPDKGVAIFHLVPADFFKIPGIIVGGSGSDAQQNFARNFVRHVFFDPGGFVLNIIDSISYMQIALLIVGAMVLIALTCHSKRSQRKLILVSILIAAGWFLYCLALYATFLFGGMNDSELNNIDVTNRYLRTYLFAMLLLVAMLLLKKVIDGYNTWRGTKALEILGAVLVIVFSIFFNKNTFNNFGVTAISKYHNQLASYDMPETKNELNEIAKISGGTFEKPVKALVTASTDYERHYLQYNALPNRVSLLLSEKMKNQSEICDMLSNSEYFVVGYYYPNEDEWNSIKACLAEDVDFSQDGIFKIRHNGGKSSLMKIP